MRFSNRPFSQLSGFRDFQGVMRTFPDPQECSEHLQIDSTFEKNIDFRYKSTDFPSWASWHSIYDEIDGSRPSEGAQRATDVQVEQKTSRTFISGPASPLRGILGCLKVES